QPEARRRAGREVLDQHVGARDERIEDRPGLRVLHVERQALLGAVGPDEMRRLPAHALVVAAREVAAARALDLDHARAEVGELARAVRRRDCVLQGDYGDAVEGSHGCFCRASILTAEDADGIPADWIPVGPWPG